MDISFYSLFVRNPIGTSYWRLFLGFRTISFTKTVLKSQCRKLRVFVSGPFLDSLCRGISTSSPAIRTASFPYTMLQCSFHAPLSASCLHMFFFPYFPSDAFRNPFHQFPSVALLSAPDPHKIPKAISTCSYPLPSNAFRKLFPRCSLRSAPCAGSCQQPICTCSSSRTS